MAIQSTLQTVAPYHVLLYSLAFGATTYQSFYNGIVAYKALPYSGFASLQTRIFPNYFRFQWLASGILMLTSPQPLNNLGWACLGTALTAALLNSFLIQPMSSRLIKQRLDQSEAEGKSHHDPTCSDEMKQLNKRFRKLHGFSVIVNLLAWGSFLVYGVELTDSLVAM